MRARLRYFRALLDVAAAGILWVAILFTVLFPSQIEEMRLIPRPLLHPVLASLSWIMYLVLANAWIIDEYHDRQEDKIAYLSREGVIDLCSWLIYMNVFSFVLIFLLGILDLHEFVIVRWIIFLWLSTNILSILHVLVAEAAHRYNKLQELKSQEALQAGTEDDLSAPGQPTQAV
ncbi:MAG: hypothetical protein HPY54_09390 [Chthonomonadetes bacterium]|nr:hypothetical protein [Chthonomonadetes bacterium]